MENLILSTHTNEELKCLINAAVIEAFKEFQFDSKKEKLLTRQETAAILHVSLVTLNDWSSRGMIKSFQIGGRILYKETQIMESLQEVANEKTNL